MVILINGKKRAGKDFFAEKLKKELIDSGVSTEILSFAYPVKDIIAKTFGIDHNALDIMKNNESCGITLNNGEHIIDTNMREVIQRFGTEAAQYWFGKTVWTEMMVNRIYFSRSSVFLIPDFRFKHEDIISTGDFEGYRIKIINNDISETDKHKSENDLNDYKFDITIDNTGQPDLSKEIQTVKNLIINDLNNP